MLIKKIRFNVFALFFIFLFLSCKGFSSEKIPYSLKATLDMNDCDEYEIAGLNLSFKNNGEKRVSEFNIVFYLFDEEGEPVSLFRSNLVLNVKTDISAGESEDFMLSLDSFFTYEPEADYYIDYVYISRIVYSDGSSWNDPFGLALY